MYANVELVYTLRRATSYIFLGWLKSTYLELNTNIYDTSDILTHAC